VARAVEQFVCQSCGAVHGKWSGRCAGCGEWNTISEEAQREAPPKGLGSGKGRILDFRKLNQHGEVEGPRTASGLGEFDRVCGGGLVPGSAVLIGGDPGIGKSTILLQVVARLAQQGIKCAYISGEEAPAQVRMRARRLGLEGAPLELAAATSVRDIVATMEGAEAPHVVVIDSIQTMYVDSVEAAPGTVSQVRTSAQELIRAAKRRDICVLLVGHVTKDGQIAGPRVLEHMVDSVLYFEGERGHQFRILRAVKNRFGPTDEIGVFEMSDGGLMEVTNPSALFLANRGSTDDITGSAVFAGLEGSRPVLVEIQALVAPSPPGSPRRTVVGWDGNRLAMVLAVLDARCGLGLAGHDVYLNVAGGLRINEPAADLAVAAALVSSMMEVPVPQEAVLFGEISLSGEVRGVAQAELRLKEAAKLGFTKALIPPARKGRKSSMTVSEISRLPELVELFARDGVKAV
jgi:DNA repair protein RadA/Sms